MTGAWIIVALATLAVVVAVAVLIWTRRGPGPEDNRPLPVPAALALILAGIVVTGLGVQQYQYQAQADATADRQDQRDAAQSQRARCLAEFGEALVDTIRPRVLSNEDTEAAALRYLDASYRLNAVTARRATRPKESDNAALLAARAENRQAYREYRDRLEARMTTQSRNTYPTFNCDLP